MIDLFIFILVSLAVYLWAYWLTRRKRWHVLIEIIFLAGILGGIYFNLANNGTVTKMLPIQITDEIRLVSFLIGLIYLITAFKISGKSL